jgi:hypothetical protein
MRANLVLLMFAQGIGRRPTAFRYKNRPSVGRPVGLLAQRSIERSASYLSTAGVPSNSQGGDYCNMNCSHLLPHYHGVICLINCFA